jgi:hypothetical protein
MTAKEFINSLANGKLDIIQILLDILEKTHSKYCLIGGLAVNAYVEPVVSLDLDIVAAVQNVKFITLQYGEIQYLGSPFGPLKVNEACHYPHFAKIPEMKSISNHRLLIGIYTSRKIKSTDKYSKEVLN